MAATPISRSRERHHDSHHGLVFLGEGRWEQVSLRLLGTPGKPLKLEVRSASSLLCFDISQAQLAVELSEMSLEVIIKFLNTLAETIRIRLADRKSLWQFIAALGVIRDPGQLGLPSVEVVRRNELDINLLDSILGRIEETQDELERTWSVLQEDA